MSILTTTGLTGFYGDFQALFGVDVTVDEAETVAIIGANGAGKSTFMRAVVGLVRAAREAVRFNGEPIGGLLTHDIVRRGIALVPEGRRLFPSLSVEENLKLGAYSARPGTWTVDSVFALFPVLKERRHAPATALSGGQQQMVAIGRALMANPRLLLCDEISLGLAPIVIRDIYAALPAIKREGVAILLVEQDINQALSVAARVYCFQEGRVSLAGTPATLSRDAIRRAYFGL